MGRMSFTQEMKMLGKAGEGADARCLREAVLFLHQELGRAENALGRAAFAMRYGQRGEWRTVLREAAAESLREARRAASEHNRDRLRRAVTGYAGLAASPYPEVAELMLRPGERAPRQTRRRTDGIGAQVRFIGELPAGNGRRRRGRGRPGRELAAA